MAFMYKTSAEEYEILNFASAETFRNACIILDEVAPVKYKSLSSLTINSKYADYSVRKTINRYILKCISALNYKPDDSEWVEDRSPQRIIEEIQEDFGSHPYAQEIIPLLKYLDQIVSNEERYAAFISKVQGCPFMFYPNDKSDDYNYWYPFVTATTRNAPCNGPSLMLDGKVFLEKIIRTDFSFNSKEGEELLDVWKKITELPFVRNRYNIMEKQEAEK